MVIYNFYFDSLKKFLNKKMLFKDEDSEKDEPQEKKTKKKAAPKQTTRGAGKTAIIKSRGAKETGASKNTKAAKAKNSREAGCGGGRGGRGGGRGGRQK